MKVKLTVQERILLVGFLNDFKGSLADMADISDDVKTGSSLSFGEDEVKQIELKQDESKITWNHEKAGDGKDIELCKTSVAYALKVIEEKDTAGEFSLNDGPVLSLRDKLKK